MSVIFYMLYIVCKLYFVHDHLYFEHKRPLALVKLANAMLHLMTLTIVRLIFPYAFIYLWITFFIQDKFMHRKPNSQVESIEYQEGIRDYIYLYNIVPWIFNKQLFFDTELTYNANYQTTVIKTCLVNVKFWGNKDQIIILWMITQQFIQNRLKDISCKNISPCLNSRSDKSIIKLYIINTRSY